MSLFKKPTKKMNIRKKVEDDDDKDDAPSAVSRIDDIRELQKSRERRYGLTEIECAVGKEKAAALEDGIEMAGGAMTLSGKQKAKMEAAGIEAGIREQFEKETMLRDEDAELQKYIEQGLRGNSSKTDDDDNNTNSDPLMRAAAKLNKYKSEVSSELLSEHMLAGIPEVDLGISARITNILETEKKKKQLLEHHLTGKPLEDEEEKPLSKRRRRM